MKVPWCCFGTERGHNGKVISEDRFQGEWVQPEVDVLGFPSNIPDMTTWNILGVHKSGCHVAHAAELLMVASHICRPLVWNVLHVTLLLP